MNDVIDRHEFRSMGTVLTSNLPQFAEPHLMLHRKIGLPGLKK
jgi:hypothetical protein